MANPDAKHYWNYDIFTYITSLSHDPGKAPEDTAAFKPREVALGDTVFYSRGFMVLEKIDSRKNLPGQDFAPTDSASVATIKVFAKTSSIYTLTPLLVNKGGTTMSFTDTATAESLVVRVNRLTPSGAELGVKESDAVLQYITLKAYKFPFINLVWLGTLIMVLGTIMSMARRIQLNRGSLRKI